MKTKIFIALSLVGLLLTANANAFDKDKGAVKPVVKKSVKVPTSYSLSDLSRNLEFDFAKIDVRMSYYDKLDQLAKYLVDNNNAIVLRGHADGIGGFKANWVISEKRAVEVKDYLIKKGVPEDKVVTTPFGSTKPIASNKTKLGRQKNRRVEIKLS